MSVINGRQDEAMKNRGRDAMAPRNGRGREAAKSGKRGRNENGRGMIRENMNGKKRGNGTVVAKRSREDESMRKKSNRQILFVAYFMSALFLALGGYLSWYIVSESEERINNPYNKRQEILAEKVTRGSIYSDDGKVLAETKTKSNGDEYRYYPYGREFCHVVGRISNSMTGVEQSQCYPLLTSHGNPFEQMAHSLKGEKKQGDSVYTTLNLGLQKAAYDALGTHKGAVVAIEPKTGKILAMVSKPDYDPNTVDEDWDELIEDSEENSVLINRCTQGVYPPGSTFKILTALEYMRENPDTYKKYSYECDGRASFGGNVIRCYGGEQHGSLNLSDAFTKSCNGAFADMGVQLSINSFRKLCEKFMFNKNLPVNFEYNKSSFRLTKDSDAAETAQTSIGQGKTTITPLQNAMITAAIANDGIMMTPYVVDHTENAAGKVVKQYEPKECSKAASEEETKVIKKMMRAVVKKGTASLLSSLSYGAAGKTGTAEIDADGTSHAWFVGYAPADNPKIVVSIVAEEAGTGGRYAVPIADQMFREYLGD